MFFKRPSKLIFHSVSGYQSPTKDGFKLLKPQCTVFSIFKILKKEIGIPEAIESGIPYGKVNE